MPFRILFIGALVFFSFCSFNDDKGEEGVPLSENSEADTIRPHEIDSSLIDTTALQIHFKTDGDYIQVKFSSSKVKERLKDATDSLRKGTFEDYLLNRIIPFWYGTPWDFNGYTDTPGKGVVACGYFVSTTLKHAGLNVDRFKLAQQDPMNEAKSLALGDSVTVYEMDSRSLQKVFASEYEEGLYFVGLDFHVGFLLFRKQELYFIHSNYIGAEGVIFEKAVYSDAFNAASKYRIVPLSTDKEFLAQWYTNSPVKIVTGK